MNESGTRAAKSRLLPWTSETGKPCILVTDGEDSYLSRVADGMEAAQIAVAQDAVREARETMSNPLANRAQLLYSTVRLTECLTDVLRIAESRAKSGPEED
jgi:hypothetical protein